MKIGMYPYYGTMFMIVDVIWVFLKKSGKKYLTDLIFVH